MLNQLRDSVAMRHPELRKYAQSYVSAVISSLYAKGYDKDAGLNEYVAECSLTKYASLWSLFKYNPLPKACRLMLKRIFGK